MPRRDHGYIYDAHDRDGVDLYVGKTDSPDPHRRLREHMRDDAEWLRHAEGGRYYRTHRDDLDHEERIRTKAANGGDGTVFNHTYNGQSNVPYRQDFIERYYDGYSTRYDTSEVPSWRAQRDRKARAEDHPSYQSRARRRSRRKKSG